MSAVGEGGGPAPRAVGNDVVDLTNPRTHGMVRPRFLRRILTEQEQEELAGAADPRARLWMLWASKEAGFKVASRKAGPPTFSHRDYEVALAPPEEVRGGSRLAGSVRWGRHVFGLEVTVGAEAVHAVAWNGPPGPPPAELSWAVARMDQAGAPWAGSPEELLRRLRPREVDAVHSPASAAVRIAARADAAHLLGVSEERLEIVCAAGSPGRRPPLLHLDGRPTAVAISLSHDGPFLAWAVWPPSPPPAGTPATRPWSGLRHHHPSDPWDGS